MTTDVYAQFGVRTVINATGVLTRAGGSIIAPEVLDAMRDAANHFVRIEDLQEAAGGVIADITGAESGYVTCGASAAVSLATAACMAEMDVRRMERLPDTQHMKREVICQKAHRNAYDHAVRAVGARMVEVGTLGYPGAGGTYAWQIEEAIGDRTAAIYVPLLDAPGVVPLEVVCELANRNGIPVIVDAAAALPPAGNLRRLVEMGAAAVAFSGGKTIGGPQASGFLAARRSIVDSVALQHQDMDVLVETWTWRERYLASGVLPGPPHQGIGRGYKVGKEEIIGLLVALRRYATRDHAADQARWLAAATCLGEALRDMPGVRAEVVVPEPKPLPQVRIHVDTDVVGKTAIGVINELAAGERPILVGQGLARAGVLTINPMNLREGEMDILLKRLRVSLVPARQDAGP